MTIELGFNPEVLTELKRLVNEGLHEAQLVLSEMTGREISMTAPHVRVVPLERIPSLVGGAGKPVTCAYVEIRGDCGGYSMLVLEPDSACLLVDFLLEYPQNTTKALDEIGVSAISEVGNVTCSSFLRELADYTGLRLIPFPPIVVTDMLGAILSQIIAEMSLSSTKALLVDTSFRGKREKIRGFLVLLPRPESAVKIAERLGAKVG